MTVSRENSSVTDINDVKGVNWKRKKLFFSPFNYTITRVMTKSISNIFPSFNRGYLEGKCHVQSLKLTTGCHHLISTSPMFSVTCRHVTSYFFFDIFFSSNFRQYFHIKSEKFFRRFLLLYIIIFNEMDL